MNPIIARTKAAYESLSPWQHNGGNRCAGVYRWKPVLAFLGHYVGDSSQQGVMPCKQKSFKHHVMKWMEHASAPVAPNILYSCAHLS